MIALTSLIAIMASILVIFVRPLYGLIVYMIVLVWYPYTLTLKLGTVDFSVSRIVILALYANILFQPNLIKRFKLILLDKLILIYFVCQILSGVTNITDIAAFLENRAGGFFDIALPYFAVRTIITEKQQYVLFLKAILWIIALLAIVACYESITGHNPLDFGRNIKHADPRWGFDRAITAFGHPIYLGVFFAMMGALCAGLLRSISQNAFLYKIGIGLSIMGILSTMSSGPLLAAMAGVLFIAFYHLRKHWKIAIIVIVLMCGLVEMISNRHFYQVIDRLAFNSRTAWYRTRLIEVAIWEGGMRGHWLAGYGFAEPGWGPRIDRRKHTDMVNHYLLILCRYGLIGFIPFCAIIVVAFKTLFYYLGKVIYESDRWLIWCLTASLFGIIVGCNSVSLFGQPINAFYIIIAFCATLPSIYDKAVLYKAIDSHRLQFPQ